MAIGTSLLAGVVTFQVMMRQLKKNKQGNFSPDGQLTVAQNIPGRLRAYSPKLKDKAMADAMTIQLARIEGIESVACNEGTGSILVTYEQAKVDHTLLVPALMKLMGLELEGKGQKQSLVIKEAQTVNQAVNHAVYDNTRGLLDLDAMLALGFIGLAIKEMLRTGGVGAPPPITLLNWAYLTLTMRGGRQ